MLGHEHTVGQDGAHDEHTEECGAEVKESHVQGAGRATPTRGSCPWGCHHQAGATRSMRRGPRGGHTGAVPVPAGLFPPRRVLSPPLPAAPARDPAADTAPLVEFHGASILEGREEDTQTTEAFTHGRVGVLSLAP